MAAADKKLDAKSGEENAAGAEQEEFVVVETDSDGKPVGGQGTKGGPGDDDEDDEEGDDDDLRAGAPEDDESEERGLGHDASRESETDEERRERRKRERRTKRIRTRVVAGAKDKQILALTQAVHGLTEKVETLQGRTVKYDENQLRMQLSTIEGQLLEARDTMSKCVKAGDGDGVAEVTEIQFTLRDQKRNLELMLNRARNAQQQQQKPELTAREQQLNQGGKPSAQQLSQAAIENAANWAKQNKWYKPDGSTKDSRRVLLIDAELTSEGYDPEDKDYWEELSDRVREELPHTAPRREGRERNDDSSNKNGTAANGNGSNGARKPGGPRMASSQSGPRKLRQNEVYISPERKSAMQAAGMWDDPAKRNKMLKEYHNYDKANPRANAG